MVHYDTYLLVLLLLCGELVYPKKGGHHPYKTVNNHRGFVKYILNKKSSKNLVKVKVLHHQGEFPIGSYL